MLDREELKVVAIGNLNIDMMLGKTDAFPSWGAEIVLPDFDIRQGGQAANYAVSMTKLGCGCRLLASVGDDTLGQFLMDQLRQSRVDTSFVTTEKNTNTAISVAIIRSDGERAFVTFLGHLDKYDIKNLRDNEDLLKKAELVHFGGYFMLPRIRGEPIAALFKDLTESGATVSFDPGWDPEGWKPETIVELKRVLQHVDVFLPNLEEARAITGCRSSEEAAEEIARMGPRLTAVKMGPDGCFVADKGREVSVPAFKADVVDTVGAGDIFDAGFTYGLLNHWDLTEVAAFSNALSAVFISRGGRLVDRCPTHEEAKSALARQRKNS